MSSSRAHHRLVPQSSAAPADQGFAELHCRSYYSFLGGASSPESVVQRAHSLGYRALYLTDVDGVPGMVKAHQILGGWC